MKHSTLLLFFAAFAALALGTSAARGANCDTPDRLDEVRQRVDDFWLAFDKYTINSNAENWTTAQNLAFAVGFVNEYFTENTSFIVYNGIPAESFNISGLEYLTGILAGLPVFQSGGERRVFDQRRYRCTDTEHYSVHAVMKAIAKDKILGGKAQRASEGTMRMDLIREERGGPLKVLRVWNEIQATYRMQDCDLSLWNAVTNDAGF